MVYCSNEEKYSMNREVKQIGILTSEPPWINESVRVKINGSFHRIRVIENPSRSLNLAPRVDDQDQVQSSEGDWLDLGHNQWENVEEMEKEISNNQGEMLEAPLGNQQPTQTIESRGYRNKESGVEVQSPREVERSVWSSDVHAKDRGVGTSAEPLEQDGSGGNFNSSNSPTKEVENGGLGPVGSRLKEKGIMRAFDLNNSPHSTGVFPFIEEVDDEEEILDFGIEDEIEQQIENEIEKKRRKRRKEGKSVRNNAGIKGASSRNNSSGDTMDSRTEEIRKTIEIGSELGINWEGNEEIVGKALDQEGGRSCRW
ncbi:hypothetical protein L2E82_50211 [Cichorium intybus]|nr:hypothetical protein L2E82_50211 [Cichorium intybus]